MRKESLLVFIIVKEHSYDSLHIHEEASSRHRMSSASTGIFSQYPESVLLINQLPTPHNFGLYAAAAEGNTPLAESLLEKGAKPNFINILEGQKTSLHIAAENGHAEAVGLLLRHGADINCIVGTTKVI